MEEAVNNLTPIPVNLDDENLIVFYNRLRNIYADMDRQYGIAAQSYGFQCQGCEDNCCLTRFYHHTYLEYLFIRRGFAELKPCRQSAIRAKAEQVYRQTAVADNEGLPVRLMCPLNDHGMCTLYPYRPMICRLHGIPHELHKPGRPVIHGPGCSAFDERCSGKSYFKFDRTPFYFEMAKLENEFKQTAGLTARIKSTIAEMILEFGSRNAEVGKTEQRA
jgi:Fe-S-cluster containining protein